MLLPVLMTVILNVSDLSFNRIVKIEGLESLQQLEVLNLSNNRISVIENMDKLEKLTHFCISNNLIDQLDNVTSFSFMHFHMLNVCCIFIASMLCIIYVILLSLTLQNVYAT